MKAFGIFAAIAAATLVMAPVYAQGEAPEEAAKSESPPVIVINPGRGVEIRRSEVADPATAAAAPVDGADKGSVAQAPQEMSEAIPPASEPATKLPETKPQSRSLQPKSSEEAAEDAAMTEAAEISKAEEQKAQLAPKAPVAQPTLAIDIDLKRQRMTVLEGGEIVHSWPISSGRYRYRTPTGTFKPVWMTKEWYSRQYDYAPMPYSIFFHGGVAIHATQATSMLGRPASHGCVRLSHKNAKTLYGLVSRHGKAMTKIVVHGTPDFDTEVAERSRPVPQPRRRAQGPRYPEAYYGYYGPPPGYGRPAKRAYAYEERPRYSAPRGYRPRGLFGGY